MSISIVSLLITDLQDEPSSVSSQVLGVTALPKGGITLGLRDWSELNDALSIEFIWKIMNN